MDKKFTNAAERTMQQAPANGLMPSREKLSWHRSAKFDSHPPTILTQALVPVPPQYASVF
jgi:hypothetical protein